MAEPQAALLAYDPLAEPLMLQPFSVLDTTSEEWVTRRRAWQALGIRPEVSGRGKELLMSNQRGLLSYDVYCTTCGHRPPKGEARPDFDGHVRLFDVADAPAYPRAGEECLRGCGGTYATYERPAQLHGALASGTSIFDPVLCEAMYRWYCKPGGSVLDPFAGGAVRGIVAWKLGRHYTGVELRQEQVDDNAAQAAEIVPGWPGGPADVRNPYWLCGDSNVVLEGFPAGPYDMLFTCPPYYDAEVYSDDPADLSAQVSMDEFTRLYGGIFDKALRLMAPNSWVAVVIGEARAAGAGITGGAEYGLLVATQQVLHQHGFVQHASLVVVNALGTLPLRLPRQWAGSRIPGRRHQYVLVYRNGDRKACSAGLEQLKAGDLPTEEAQDVGSAV